MMIIMGTVLLVHMSELYAGLQQSYSCSFNSMCSCSSDQHNFDSKTIREVSCIAVPFFKLPNLPESSISQLEVVGSRIPALEAESLAGCQVHSLTLSNNHLQLVADRAFSSTTKSLKYLDFSYNELDGVPFQALKDLRTLQWLNLHGNQIHSITGDWSHMKTTLANLFLGENDITEIPSEHFSRNHHGLNQFKALIWLNLDGNRISEIQRHSLPASLQTVSISRNLIESFPLEVVSTLPRLQWLYLRANHIRSFPEHTFAGKIRLEKIDLSENYLKNLQRQPFNNSLYVRDLNLSFNDLKLISDACFTGLRCGRIILSYNQLEVVDKQAFDGVEDTLEFLDFDHNNLAHVPFALGRLRTLKYLYLSSNSLVEIPENVFEGCCDNLKAVSFSGNRLTRIPSKALQNCSRILHFNIAYNEIYEIFRDDFLNWGQNIKSLVLDSNRITSLRAQTFADLKKLKELSLSFNPLRYINVKAFDGLHNLESLELSFSLQSEKLGVNIFQAMPSLQWLSIDNNNFHSLPKSLLDYLPELKYVNLESNKLNHIPSNLFKNSVHSKLKDVRFSCNEIKEVHANTFRSLNELETVVLSNNRISRVHKNAFNDLPNLRQLILSDNSITKISAQSVSNAFNLQKVDLHNNLLNDFSFSCFANVSSFLHLNLSRNRILTCNSDDDKLPNNVDVLDLRHNKLESTPRCLEKLALLRRLFLDYNLITSLEHNALMHLTSLEILTLKENNVANVSTKAFFGLQSLQFLDLSGNLISHLHANQFSSTPKLRVLNLRKNNMNYLPKDVFSNTIIEKLDLSFNSFSVIPSPSLTEVGTTLRQFSISSNNIEHIDSRTFLDISYLQCLDLSDNKLTILPDNVFANLGLLQKLKLNSNPLRANFKELFHYAQNLRELNLANSGISSTPTLPLPKLIHLNLSQNNIEIFNRNTVQNLLRLRYLDLSFNHVTHIPTYLWMHLPGLKTLDLSNNPIKELASDNFQGLRNLQVLNIQGLKKLEKFESKALTQIKILSSLSMDTWPKIENFRSQLCTLLANLHQLRILKLHVQDAVLDDQLLCASNRKISHLEITGRNLRSIDKNAFARFTKNPDLKLIISDTEIEELPAELFSNMYKISYLTIDLRNNMLSHLSPEIFYGNVTTWENVGTTLLSGGLTISENPFKCGCHLAWLSYWLRRWMRESLQSHNAPVETVTRMNDALKEAVCWDVFSSRKIPIVQLMPEDMSCHASALSTASSSNKLSVILIILYYYVLSVFYVVPI